MGRKKKEETENDNLDLFSALIKDTGNEYASLASEGIDTSDIEGHLDTGCYIINGLVSGNIHGGLPGNKITVIAGDSGTGKTMIVLNMVKQFLNQNSGGRVIYFDSEAAITKRLLEEMEIDVARVHILPVCTVEEFRYQVIKILDGYVEKQIQTPMMVCLDSVGQLSTKKEMEDTAAGNDTRDMTRAALIKATFRVITLKLAKAKVPLVVTNHTYASMSMYEAKKMGGGAGLQYSPTNILFLSKKKDKDGKEHVGNVVVVRNEKSRFTQEGKIVEAYISFHSKDAGFDRYFGMIELGVKQGVFESISNKILFPNGDREFVNKAYEDPGRYIIPYLEQLQEAAYKEFMYGSAKQAKNDCSNFQEE